MKPLVLFDFDGTLADTAPDLAAAANRQRLRRGLEPLPYERLRPMASHGARGLLRVALGITPESPGYEAARQQFLEDYARDIAVHTRLFPGVVELLEALRADGLRWGIVTNKITRLALPLVDHLALAEHAAVVVCGDTTPFSKPHPEPLLHAARSAGAAPASCVYVGDDLRDVQAGRTAGMKTIAVAYGYSGDGEPVANWGADAVVQAVAELRPAIETFRFPGMS
ncbi:phosphoglycolate phosphatase [Pigmentiphaga soli]